MSKSISNWPNKRSISDTANQKFHVVNQLWCEMAYKQASKQGTLDFISSVRSENFLRVV